MTINVRVQSITYSITGEDKTGVIPREATSAVVEYRNGIPSEVFFIFGNVESKMSPEQRSAVASVVNDADLVSKVLRLLQGE